MSGVALTVVLLVAPLALVSAGSTFSGGSSSSASSSQSVSLSQSDVLLAIALGAGRQRENVPMESSGTTLRLGSTGSGWGESMLPQSEMERDIRSDVYRTIAKYS